ncbi:ParB/RepB/Spo0J family partition protein [Salipiger sp. IMCC34102]|uniref:ParB/RepB/Spo0J family partition protein n=1 Tax=Salipiger sp. IMCC34102 TaxID=2510647 RepID=UPI00101C9C0A|nr:ParB/RepB/Spo0J family partition protein [Salipiger sp. IMCC34102]RYH04211.1 ParB/RepB/Spo0J family partition protein [Salipiger sp. IMCC34102]
MSQPPKSRGLGRGLSALMSDVHQPEPVTETQRPTPDLVVPIERVHPNPDQPRRRFDEQALQDLAASISEKGVIQPLIVRRLPGSEDDYQIVAGERRWRASQIARKHDIPVLVREFDDTEVLEIAIIENIQRADLNPVDEATGYRQLMDRFGHTQDQLASALGKSRSHIANQMRLLNLPEDVLEWLAEGKLSAGHARTLIGHDKATDLAKQIISKGLSVRAAEKLVKTPEKTSRGSSRSKPVKDPDTVALERELSASTGMQVSIDHTAGQEGGKVTVQYRDLGQLDDLMRMLGGS